MCAASARPRAAQLDPPLRPSYLQLVEQHYGLHLTPHQARDLDAAVRDLLPEAGVANAAALYDLLAAGGRPDLLETLAARLTVGETHFFRIGPQIDALRQIVLPDVLARRAPPRRLRLWSAGCSSGEETYTLAILVREALTDADAWQVDLVGTDISRPALAAARRAVYGEWSFRGTPQAVRGRYFQAEGSHWRLDRSIREMARFAYLNLAADATTWQAVVGTDLDVILCRNVTIYFGREAAQALYARLAAALAPGGWLVLGPSDPAPELAAGLDWVFAPNAVLWRRPLPEPPASEPAATSALAPAPRRPPPAPRRVPSTLDRRRRALATPAAPRAASATPPPVARAAAGGSAAARRAALARRVAAAPLDADAQLQLGLLDLDDGAAERALGSLRRAAFLAPDSALAHYSLGRAWQRLGDAARARAALLHARRLLAAVADTAPVAGGHDLPAGELRAAVEAELRVLDGVPSPHGEDRR
ncbi:MAG TPA: CheR family methyltransferase [Chloroflexota bacterium]|nr:CheR family methyltransferase [Chloroflexota bacterium]